MDATVQSLALWAPDLKDSERARRAIATQKMISALPSEQDRREYDLFNIRLYSRNNDLLLYDLFNENFVDAGRAAVPATENSKNNRAKAALDTLASQVASTDVRARFEGVDLDYRGRRRLRELQNFADGLADDLQLAKHKRRAFMDAAVFESGVGIVHLYRDGDRVAAQRRLATEVSIDPSDGFVDGVPRTLYTCRPVPRANVRTDFGGDTKKDEAIDRARSVSANGTPLDQILVYETWTLPTSPDAEDGYHIVAVDTDGGDLVVDPYKKPFHELVFFSIEDRFTGAWGQSLMGLARDLQIRINANDFRIERSTKIFHAQHLYVDRASNIKKSSLSNELGTVWEGTGPNAPQQIKFQCAPAELYSQQERDGQRIFEDLGVNLQSSQGSTEAGLDASGEARREAKKSLDGRNSLRQQRYEEFHLALLRVAISIVRDIVATPPEDDKKKSKKTKPKKTSYVVQSRGKRGYSRIDFAEIAVDEANYRVLVKPASVVPTDPEGLKAHGQEMVDLGIWQPDQLAEAWQDLDLDGRTNSTVSKRRNLEKKFDRALYDDAPISPPDEFTDLKLAMQVGLDALSLGEEDGVPEKNLERVRRYLRQVMRLAPPPAAPAAPAPAPGASPG